MDPQRIRLSVPGQAHRPREQRAIECVGTQLDRAVGLRLAAIAVTAGHGDVDEVRACIRAVERLRRALTVTACRDPLAIIEHERNAAIRTS